MFALAGLILGSGNKKASALTLAVWAVSLWGSPALGLSRDIASQAFPNHRLTSDDDRILDNYKDYLNFVLEVGQGTNAKSARLLEERFEKLKKADEKLAARFLKGLRFEMHQKLELSGLSPARVSTNNAEMRRWVNKYLGAWLREVDEYQYRAYANAVARR